MKHYFTLAMITCFGMASLNAQVGLDADFGTGGKTLDYFGGNNQMADMELQPDGKIIAVGAKNSAAPDTKFLVVRYLANGALDASFGEQGMVVTNEGTSSRAMAVVIQPDGKILVCGNTENPATLYYSDMMVVRYLENGSPDPDFGTNGIVTIPRLRSDSATALLLQPDGKILLGGTTSTAVMVPFSVVRLNTDGAIDTTFGDAGYATNAYGNQSVVNEIKFLSDGSIVGVGGFASKFVLFKFTAQGNIDNTFGEAGLVIVEPQTGQNEQLMSLTVLPNNEIIVMGSTINSLANNKMNAVLMKFGTNGQLVGTFGDNGKVVKDFGTGKHAVAREAAVKVNGDLMVGFGAGLPTDYDFVLASYDTATGEVNTGFGDNGFFTVVFGDGHDYFESVLIQPDGKILMGGSKGGYCLARLIDGALQTNSFDTQGSSIQIHPNPVTAESLLTIDLESAQILDVELFDVRGVSLGTILSNKPVLQGQNSYPLDFAHLSDGLYTLRLTAANGFVKCVRFVK